MAAQARSLLLMLLLSTSPAWCGPSVPRTVIVVYPEIGEPYHSVFAKIIEGVEAQAQKRVLTISVDGEDKTQQLTDELHRLENGAVIALGRSGLRTAAAIGKSTKVVIGGVLSLPEAETQGFDVHSLSPDPALLFARLKEVMPGARRVTVVFDPRQNAWLIRLAREAARVHGLELVAHEATDLKSSIGLYQDFAQGADTAHDVLWLPQDTTTVEEGSVVPLIMQEAWRRKLAVISSNIAHVRRGALFSLSPDFVGLGRNLATLALSEGALPNTLHVQPLINVLLVVNTRTAHHLGLDLDPDRVKIDAVFPEN